MKAMSLAYVLQVCTMFATLIAMIGQGLYHHGMTLICIRMKGGDRIQGFKCIMGIGYDSACNVIDWPVLRCAIQGKTTFEDTRSSSLVGLQYKTHEFSSRQLSTPI